MDAFGLLAIGLGLFAFSQAAIPVMSGLWSGISTMTAAEAARKEAIRRNKIEFERQERAAHDARRP